jgi:hypothetical protein
MQQSVVEDPAISEAAAQPGAEDPATNSEKPPYPFDTAATLLALTRKHNVSFPSFFAALAYLMITCAADDHRTDCARQRGTC